MLEFRQVEGMGGGSIDGKVVEVWTRDRMGDARERGGGGAGVRPSGDILGEVGIVRGWRVKRGMEDRRLAIKIDGSLQYWDSCALERCFC